MYSRLLGLFSEPYLDLANELNVPINFSILTANPHEHPLCDFVLSADEFKEVIMSVDKKSFTLNNNSEDITDLSFRSSCGAGKLMLSIDAEGNVFPCHMLHYDEFCLGNIFKQPLAAIRKSKKAHNFYSVTVDDFVECKECGYKYFCGGGCKARRFLLNGNILGKDDLCEGTKTNYRKIIGF